MLSLERYVYLKFNNFYSNEEDFYDVKSYKWYNM
jgi:hypothetical protein